MKYTDIVVGLTVLYSHYQPSHRFYDLSESKLVTVVEKDLPDAWWGQEGGWTGRQVYRKNERGIRVRFEDGEETVVQSRQLTNDIEKWKRRKAQVAERNAERAAIKREARQEKSAEDFLSLLDLGLSTEDAHRVTERYELVDNPVQAV